MPDSNGKGEIQGLSTAAAKTPPPVEMTYVAKGESIFSGLVADMMEVCIRVALSRV